jgi:hypothetical protein
MPISSTKYQNVYNWNASASDPDLPNNRLESHYMSDGNSQVGYFKKNEMIVDSDIDDSDSHEHEANSHMDNDGSHSTEPEMNLKPDHSKNSSFSSVRSDTSMDTESTVTMATCTPICATYQNGLEQTIKKLDAHVADLQRHVRMKDRKIDER